ncbi:MAG: radical SAM protein [Candidatus Omnitrophota bacterium]|jgi:radical SAM superfamily enzyme YgiQ (UPF0313 family)
MRVLLINPGMDFSKFGTFKRYMQPMPPIGLAYLAAALKKEGLDFRVIDDFADRIGIRGIIGILQDYPADIVGISCLTPSAPYVLQIADAVRQYDKKIKIILGNIHASIFYESILRQGLVDVIVHGEGESTFPEVVSALAQKKELQSIPGISFMLEGKAIKTEERALRDKIDSLPYPAWEYFPVKKYGFLPFMDIAKPALSVLASRGCVYKCSYCSLLYMNNHYRQRDPLRVVDEIEYLVDKFNVKQVGFVDPIFPLYKKSGINFSLEMIKRGLNKKLVWICETRIDSVDKELLGFMKEAGCKRILYGIESGNQKTLDGVSKDTSLDLIRKNISDTRKLKIEATGLFMLGFPQETRPMMEDTLKLSRELDLDFAKFAITIPFPGSELYVKLTQAGKLRRQDWDNFVTFNPDPKKLVSINEHVSARDLIALQRRAHREFYLRPRLIWRHLFRIKSIKKIDMLNSLVSFVFHGRFN